MNKAIIVLIIFLGLLTASSCASSKRVTVEDKRRGFLMLEGENIYKNKGFYKPKNTYKPYKKKNQKKLKKRMRASNRRYR
jgi:hypothetical protein